MVEPHTGAATSIEARVRSCRICVERPAQKRPLPHEPRPVLVTSSTARLCVAGQAPGLRVHRTGKPFNDRSGQRLREWMGIGETEFYDPALMAIVPMGFCFPGYDDKGSDLPPRRECRATWHDAVFAAMPQIEIVLAIGAYAMDYHLGRDRERTMTETVRNWRRHLFRNERPRVLPLPHPSWRNTGWLKRNSWFEDEVVPVLRDEVATAIRDARELAAESDDHHLRG